MDTFSSSKLGGLDKSSLRRSFSLNSLTANRFSSDALHACKQLAYSHDPCLKTSPDVQNLHLVHNTLSTNSFITKNNQGNITLESTQNISKPQVERLSTPCSTTSNYTEQQVAKVDATNSISNIHDEPVLSTEHKEQSSAPKQEVFSKDFVTLLHDKDTQLSELRALLTLQNEKIESQNSQIVKYTEENRRLQIALFELERKYLQQVKKRKQLDKELEQLNLTTDKLESQIYDLERIRSEDQKKINLLSAYLIERDTDVSLLKLKLTRVQTSTLLTPKKKPLDRVEEPAFVRGPSQGRSTVIGTVSEKNDIIEKSAVKLDYLMVARWLDDIGLPQYKEEFIKAKIDGKALNSLTIQNLVDMNITSSLHISSIRCSVKVLRAINFDLQQLQRRATVEEIAQVNSMRERIAINQNSIDADVDLFENKSISSHVSYWTCHRVMEWLRLINFSEYSSSLRGSGLNGALIVYDDGFNADTMCSILSIPKDKTLLRRHLQTFFNSLIGKDLTAKKYSYMSNPSNIVLTPSAEIKTQKKTPFSPFKRKSFRVAQENKGEYLCPINSEI